MTERSRWPAGAGSPIGTTGDGGPRRTDGGRAVASRGLRALLSDGGLFAARPDPALGYEHGESGVRVAALNDAYAAQFGLDADWEGPLAERLSADLDVGEELVDERDVADVSALAAAAGESASTEALVEAQATDREYLARVVPTRASPDAEADGTSDGADAEADADSEAATGDGPAGTADADGDATAEAPTGVEAGGGFVVLTDVTRQRERLRSLARERDRLDEFASIVSHDLRNPIEVASIQLEAAEQRGDAVHFEKVAGALDRMEAIVEDVLTLAREGRVIDAVDAVDLEVVAADAWETVSAPEATLAVETGAAVEADAGRLQELLANLFRNAVQHGGPAVTVTVDVLADESGFFVADDGPGIPEADRERVFEGGVSTAEGGTGLGLRIVGEIAEAHGWTVTATAGADGGARFEFTGVALDP